MILASILVFALSRMSGDPRLLFLTPYFHNSEEQWERWGVMLGLDKPYYMQYLIWLGNCLTGDWGQSIDTKMPVITMIGDRIPTTLKLTLGGFIFSFLVGIPLGVISGVYRGTIWDYLGRTISVLGQSVPAFWLAIVLILIFAVQLRWLPAAGQGGFSHYIMPSIVLGWFGTAGFLRLTRSAMLDVMDSEYVKLARAKGASNQTVIWKHAFRNAVIAPLTYGGLLLAGFATGTVLTETIFAWPGLGRMALQAVLANDFPVLQGSVIFFALFYVILAFILDMTYALIDPRIRYA
jgi:peptide/nickel transport system permease protein